MTAFRLPLELELHILKLATPPLAMDSLADRVKFLIKVSLVHRSFTAWAQDKLAEQFVYTYTQHKDVRERLEQRLRGVACHGKRSINRLYLDLTRWPKGDDVAGQTWPLQLLGRDFGGTLTTLWVKPSAVWTGFVRTFPRLKSLTVDDTMCQGLYASPCYEMNDCRDDEAKYLTHLALRNVDLEIALRGMHAVTSLVMENATYCALSAAPSFSEMPSLRTLVASPVMSDAWPPLRWTILASLPSTIQSVHFVYERVLTPADFFGSYSPLPANLEDLRFVYAGPAPPTEALAKLAGLELLLKSQLVNHGCRVTCTSVRKTPKAVVDEFMAELFP
ncbi:hypothetical protein JCM10908_006788 [Rhodotorula pacifica]|uniref:uncharacterized protein n=1 Tax=Rhodotorula pacifica TaxID=1495444 RepID=UPI003170B88B